MALHALNDPDAGTTVNAGTIDAADLLGITIEQEFAGGGSDGNWTSLVTPTLDGLGTVGDGAPALNEHVIEAIMPERSALLACLLMGEPVSSTP